MGLVFLGGSCNPTTWRTDIAIPLLETHHITYFNPQVDEWKPELIQLEHEAKEKAEVLFFTIDNRTRSVVSIIECAYLSGCSRNLVMVQQTYHNSQEIHKEQISNREFKDILCGQIHLKDLTEREYIPSFRSIDSALECTLKIIKEDTTVQELTRESCHSAEHHETSEEDKFTKTIYESLKRFDSATVSIQDIITVLKFITGKDIIDCSAFQNAVDATMNQSFESLPTAEKYCHIVDFKQFSEIMKAYFKGSEVTKRTRQNFMYVFKEVIIDRVWCLLDSVFKQPNRSIPSGDHSRRNVSAPNLPPRAQVYLGGSCDNTKWREQFVVPMLRKNGISYFNPVNDNWTERLVPTELAMIEACDVILFVITGETRSLAAMTLAAYYIGKKRKVVLCVQDVGLNCLVAGEILTKQAVNDYNRGRAYLRDMAVRNDVALFNKVQDTVKFVVNMLH